MTTKRDSSEEIQRLIPLRVSDDLTTDESALVDQEIRYSDKSRADLESYSALYQILRDASAEELPVENRPSLWEKIEPRLGPAGRQRKQSRIRMWVPTWQLAAACVALFALTMVIEMRPEPATLHFPNQNMVVDVNNGALPQPAMLRANIRSLGTIVQDITPEVRRRLPFPESAGVIVVSVLPGSPAEQDGIRFGDILLGINGQKIDSVQSLLGFLGTRKNGEEVQVDILRNGVRILETLRLGIPEASKSGKDTKNSLRQFHEEAFQVATPHLAGNWTNLNIRGA